MKNDGQERTGCDLKMKMCGEDNLGENTPSSHKKGEIPQKSDDDGKVGTDVDGLLGQIE